MLPCHISRKRSHILQKVGTVTSLNILHHHAEVLPRLKAAVHGDNKGVVREGHDVSLCEHLLHLVPQDQVVFVDLLSGNGFWVC